MRTIELTEKEWEIWNQVQENVDSMIANLAALSKEQRFRWYREHQYSYPISFEKEIGGTVYTVSANFSDKAKETIEAKGGRIVEKN